MREELDLNTVVLKLINSNPSIWSILYDLDLLPEQLEKGTKDWNRMCIIALNWPSRKP